MTRPTITRPTVTEPIAAEPTPPRRDERGVAALELVVLAPVLIAVLGLGVVGGRIAKTDLELASAARAAARAASVQRDATAALGAAQEVVATELGAAGVTCHQPDVVVTTGPPGGTDHVHLSCTVPLGDVDLIGVGPSKTMTVDAYAPVDTFRQLGP